MKIEELVKGKKVLFITTKNIDYIRNTQETDLLRKASARTDLICSEKKSYPARVLEIFFRILWTDKKSYDVIFAGFAPQLILPFIRKKNRRYTIAADFFISVYDTLVCDRKKLKKGGMAARLCHKLDEKTLRKADSVIADTNAHADFFAEEFHCSREKIETLYLRADERIYNKEVQPDRTENRTVVLYFGSVLPLQGVETILEAAKLLKDQKDLLFDIIGPIPETYHKPVQENIVYTEWLQQEDLAKRIAGADLCLAGHFNGTIDKAKRTIPGKAYIYEAMGKKMILGDNPANHELFIEDERHFFVPMGDEKALAECIFHHTEPAEEE